MKIKDVLVGLDEDGNEVDYILQLEDIAGNEYQVETSEDTARTISDLMNQIEENQKLLK